MRKEFLKICKEKIRSEEKEKLKKDISTLFEYLETLTEHKLKLQEEMTYLSDYHLKKLNEIIENYEKNVEVSSIPQGLIPINFDLKNDRMYSLMSEDVSFTGSSIFIKFILEKRDYPSSKSVKESGNGQVFLKKKKNRPTKLGKKEKEEDSEELGQNYELSLLENEKFDSEPRYCHCNMVSYGDMVKCDNDFVHFYNLV
jgi:hypothetical protein